MNREMITKTLRWLVCFVLVLGTMLPVGAMPALALTPPQGVMPAPAATPLGAGSADLEDGSSDSGAGSADLGADPVQANSSERLSAQDENDSYSYIYRSWNGSALEEETRTATECTVITKDTRDLSGWYVAIGDITIDDGFCRLKVHGEANIILHDGAKLTLDDGIEVTEGNTLNIYAQPGGTGELYCHSDNNDYAAIGSNDEDGKSCGTVNIHGGKVTANTYTEGEDAAGIGGGQGGDGGNVTIYGGTVLARGGSETADGGAGIGGGGSWGDGGKVTIYGGDVTAEGGVDGAGIGGGDKGNGAEVEIYGGTVKAHGGAGAAGIGGGQVEGDEYKTGGSVKIYGGSVEAIGGYQGAGIGGGEGGSGAQVEISGGTVVAKGCRDDWDGGAGIGTGHRAGNANALPGSIKITGGNVTAEGGPDAAGIGGGNNFDGDSVEISGGTVTAKGGTGNIIGISNSGGAGIGGGQNGSGGDITITGGTVIATGGYCAAGIGGGDGGSGGTIAISNNDIAVTATGGPDGAGIGGGNNGSGGTITLNAAKITATGGGNATAIGGGDAGSGGTIYLKDCDKTITVTAGGDAAAIGGGEGASSGVIEIENCDITAKGADYAAAIGGGDGNVIGSGDAAGDGDTITIRHSTITAEGGEYAAGIGGGRDGEYHEISILDSTVTATGGRYGGAGIGGGHHYAAIGQGGTIKIENATVTAKGYGSGAGIGGGGSCSGGTFVITNSNVKAEGGERDTSIGGAGIGGGRGGNCGDVAITDSTVEAKGNQAAGIGGGNGGDGGTVTITRSKVTAFGEPTDKDFGLVGAGIGGGPGCASQGSVDISYATVEVSHYGQTWWSKPVDEYKTEHGEYYGVRIEPFYKVTYDANYATSGTAPTDSREYRRGGNVVVAGQDDLKNTLHTFAGWNTKADGSGDTYQPGESIPIVQSDITLYAKWEAEPIPYLDWDDTTHALVEKTCDSFIVATDKTTTFEDGKWYVVTGELTSSDRIIANGTVHLIIMDARQEGETQVPSGKLTAKKGITVGEGNSLIIHGQTSMTGELNAGVVQVPAEGVDEGFAAIGGAKFCPNGSVTINGCKVTAIAGIFGAGIGGGQSGAGGEVTINGGTVTAKGTNGGAGIGGGLDASGSAVTINGGTVIATGHDGGAGIGGGKTGRGGDVTINGGTVTASGNGGDSGWRGGAGIGGGSSNTSPGGDAGTVAINGGTVTATGGENGGAGIGNGKGGKSGTVTIKNSLGTDASFGVDATGYNGSAGIGGNVTIEKSKVKATGGSGAAGIGGNDGDSSSAITITDNSIVEAIGGQFAAGIGGGKGGNSSKIEIINNCTVTATGGVGGEGSGDGGGAGIGGGAGTGNRESGNSGNITISNSTVTATGHYGGAGIGGGYWGANNGEIVIEGGSVVTATASNDDWTKGCILTGGGAGIGGGDYAHGGTIKIIYSTVTATGACGGAGIGGGNGAEGGSIEIDHGTVNAYTGNHDGIWGAGIGNGYGRLDNDTVGINGRAEVKARDKDATGLEKVETDTYIANHNTYLDVEITPCFQVFYDANYATSGTVPEDPTLYKSDGTATVLDNTGGLQNILHKFGGWNTAADGKGTAYQPGETINHIHDDITLYAKWEATENVPYLDWDGSALVEKKDAEACSYFATVTGQTQTFDAGMWYVVDGAISNPYRIKVVGEGDVHLILKDAAVLDVPAGITVSEGSTLVIHGQSGMTGTLNAKDSIAESCAGIGGELNNVNGGAVTVNGCKVETSGGMYGAGIGGGGGGAGGTLTVNGGVVTARGGANGGAGIGGGRYGEGSTVTINGGTVTAEGSVGNGDATGIGGGQGQKGGEVTINGGTVNATGAGNGAGIGGGTSGSAGGKLTVNGGTVTATGGSSATAIGGKSGQSFFNGGEVTLSGNADPVGIGGGNGYDWETHFNGAVVRINNTSGKRAVFADISFDDASLSQCVGYKESGTDRVRYAFGEDRIITLTAYRNADYMEVKSNGQTIEADDVTVVYGAKNKKVSAVSKQGGAISYAVKAGSEDYIGVDATTGVLEIKKVPANGKAYVTVTAAATGECVETKKDVTVNVVKATPISTAPTARELTYTGAAQELVNAGTAQGGEMRYALGDEAGAKTEYAASVPKGVEGGTYHVWYKVFGDENHNDTPAKCVTATIGKIAPTITATPTAKSLTYTGAAQELVNAGSAQGGEMRYALGDETGAKTDYAAAIPTATDAGTYHVWYKVFGDASHSDTEPACVTATIASKEDPDPGKPTYSATAGAGATWTKGSGADLAFTFKRSADDGTTFDRFTGIRVDGADVGADGYAATAGSVNVALKAAYLETLAVGDHTLTAVFSDGSADARFTVAAAPAPSKDSSSADSPTKNSPTKGSSPNTGDAAPIALVAACAALGALALLASRLRLRTQAGTDEHDHS